MITFSLPYPPSANKIWRNLGDRVVKSADYRQWLFAANAAIPFAARGVITGRCGVTVIADRPDRRARDIDNLAKPILDVLKPQKNLPLKGVIRDDHLVAPLVLDWSSEEPVANPMVRVTITPVEAA